MENREFYTVDDQRISRSVIFEEVENIIKVETDIFDDYVWESTIEIPHENIVDDNMGNSTIEMSNDVDNQNNVELPFESQNITGNNINDFNGVLKNHLAEDKIQLNLKTNKCKYCEKKFKLKFGLNRHIQNRHKYKEIQGDIKNIKREEYSNANAKDRNTSFEILNSQSTVSVVPHNSITHNCLDLNIKQEKDMSTNVIETNNSDQINLPNSNESMILTVSHNSIVEDCHVLNIKEEKTTQSSVQMNLVNDNETSYSDINDLNNSSNTIEKKYFYCNTSKKVCHSLVSFKAHEAHQNKPLSFSCKYCDRKFSGKGQCTNHEKSHIRCEEKKRTNVRRRSSDQINLMNSNGTIVSAASSNSVKNDLNIQCKKKIKREEYSNSNAKNRNISYEILNSQSTVSVVPHNSITHNCLDLNIKQEKDMSTNVIETNNSDQINLPNSNESMILTVSHNSIVEDCHVLNIKQENKSKKKKSTFCSICNEDFPHIGALTNHMNIHMDRKPYICQYCYQQFSREGPYNLHKKKHMLINDDQKPTIKFTSNQDSKTFIKSLRYKCNYCEKTYCTPSHRLTHMKKFHIESNTKGSYIINYEKPQKPKKPRKSKKPARSEVCLERFNSSGHLRQHMSIHLDDKPYTCVKCNRGFRFMSDFKRHMKGKCDM